jgi:hypothetical protein
VTDKVEAFALDNDGSEGAAAKVSAITPAQRAPTQTPARGTATD